MGMKLGMCGFTIGAAAYFKQFPVVEVQQTFYDPPPIATLEKWRRQAPAGFEFTMKAWQVITHLGESPTYRRLRRPMSDRERAEAGAFRTNETTLAAWQTTLEARDTLDATAILFQCPASFRPTEDNVAAMRRFLTRIDRPARVRLRGPRVVAPPKNASLMSPSPPNPAVPNPPAPPAGPESNGSPPRSTMRRFSGSVSAS